MTVRQSPLDVFADSVTSVLSSIAETAARHRETTVKQDSLCEKDLCALLEFSGHAHGSAALCLSARLAAAISRRITSLTGGDLTDAMISDTACELVNQIAGTAKTQLENTPFHFTLHTPRCISDRSAMVATSTGAPCIRMLFDVDGDEVILLLCMISGDGTPLTLTETGNRRPADAPRSDALVIEEGMEQIVEGFVIETEESLEKLDADLLALGETPGDKERINSAFRALHTLKGNSLALGFDKLNTLVHRTEDVIRKARDGELTITQKRLDIVLSAVDLIKALLQDVRDRRKSRQDLAPMIDTLQKALAPEQEPGEIKLRIDEEMEPIVDGFVTESDELLAKLDQDLVGLEPGAADSERIGGIFRAFHTLKGNARALSFSSLEALVHKTEDIVRKVRDGKAVVCPPMVDVVLRAVDGIRLLLDDIRKRIVGSHDFSKLETELRLVFEEKYDELAALREKPRTAEAAPVKKAAATTIRVGVNRLEELMNVAGELVLNKNSLLNLIQKLEQGVKDLDTEEYLNEVYARMSILVADLQSTAMSTRMQPIGKVFGKYPRVVRDLARDLGKEIELVITGEETELDNTIIEEIGDPLIHLVRNSCDHGIETPDVRRAKGKPGRGKLELRAYQEGTSVIIEIRDDGKGLDPEVLRRKGIEKGLITEAQAASMPQREIFNLIFAPGFSTATVVTAVSGRGVGMDVVKTNITKLKGVVELDSVKDQWTSVKIRLPLTLAVITGLEVEIEDERYLLPQESVVELMRVAPGERAEIIGRDDFLFRKQYRNPLVDLKQVLGTHARDGDAPGQAYIVVIGEVAKRTGILVDNVLQQHEVVLRPLGKYVGNFALPEMSGATIMGDGSVELVLNPGHLIAVGQEMRAKE